MEVRIRDDNVEISGYVNAIERKSKPLMSRIGQFIERICKGAFKKAIQRNDNIRLLLNHNWERDLGGTKDGNLVLTEDNIGLHARATITDKEVIEKARNGSLVGWSFGFNDREVENSVEHGIPTRDVKDLDLYEVSILDRTKTPAYEGTLISVRSDDNVLYFGEPLLEPLASLVTDKNEFTDTKHARESQEDCEECKLKPDKQSEPGKAGSEPVTPSEAGSDGSSIREAGGATQLYWAKYDNLLKEMKGEI